MRCETCAFHDECEGLGRELKVCRDYDPTEQAQKEEREAYAVDKADAKRKGLDF